MLTDRTRNASKGKRKLGTRKIDERGNVKCEGSVSSTAGQTYGVDKVPPPQLGGDLRATMEARYSTRGVLEECQNTRQEAAAGTEVVPALREAFAVTASDVLLTEGQVIEDLSSIVSKASAFWGKVTSKIEVIATQTAENVMQVTDQVDEFLTSAIHPAPLPASASLQPAGESPHKVRCNGMAAAPAVPHAGPDGWDVADDAWDAAEDADENCAPLCNLDQEFSNISLSDKSALPLQDSNARSSTAQGPPVPRSPAQPHTPGPASPRGKQAATFCSTPRSDSRGQSAHCPCSAADGRPASMEPLPSPVSVRATPSSTPQPIEQVSDYKRMCDELRVRSAAFEMDCAALVKENDFLKSHLPRVGCELASSDAMADQLAQQLQVVMQEKARLQHEKEQLQQDNGHLAQMLDYARAMMDGDEGVCPSGDDL